MKRGVPGLVDSLEQWCNSSEDPFDSLALLSASNL